MKTNASVEPLCPIEVKGGGTLAGGMRAGDWTFATGHLAYAEQGTLDGRVADEHHPRRGRPRHEKEAGVVFGRMQAVLDAAGMEWSNVVRFDQFYTTWRAVPHYHIARHRAFGGSAAIPASTSILIDGLLLPGAAIEASMVAYRPPAGMPIQALRPDGLEVAPVMGFAPTVRAGDYVFLSGQMAENANDGIAPEVKVPPTHLWKGLAIKLETEHTVKKRLEPALSAGGSSLANVVKAQAYISDVDDIPAFNQIWNACFPTEAPALTIVPTARPGFNCPDAHVEINVMAVADGGSVKKQVVSAPGVHMPFENQTQAVRAGDLLLISGLMAVNEDGVVPAALRDPSCPYFGGGIRAEMEAILEMAQTLCEAAGTSLENVLRIQQFHTDLDGFNTARRVWSEVLGDRPLPLSAVRVPSPLAVPGCSVQVDLWVYVP